MRLFFADLLMLLGALAGLLAIPWTLFAGWALVASVGLASVGLALDWRNGPRRVAYLGCVAIGWQVVGMVAAAVLLATALVLRHRGRVAATG